jgi:hypothetical protein
MVKVSFSDSGLFTSNGTSVGASGSKRGEGHLMNTYTWFALLWIVSGAVPALSCSIVKPPDPVVMVRQADLILRVTAVEYSGQGPGTTWTTGVPVSDVRFAVEEIVKGIYEKPTIILPGYLSERDDWHDQTPPYTFVRPGGRSGSCFANTYRKGGQFLLVLKKLNSVSLGLAGRPADGYTVNWYALGPVNEQLRSANDPWVQWVREQIKAN